MEHIDPAHDRFFPDIRQHKADLRPVAPTAIVLEVTWVDQSNHWDPCQRIRRLGGVSGKVRWQHTHAQAIQSLEQGRFAYYVQKGARALKLELGLDSNGDKYLKTPADIEQFQYLLSLPNGPRPSPL